MIFVFAGTNNSSAIPEAFGRALGRILLIGALLVGFAIRVSAQEAGLTSRVTDEADLLSVQTEHTLTALLAAHEDSTSNQVAVLTVTSLQGEAIESFALRVAETTGLGRAEKDNGVLLVVAHEDRKVRIEVGYGLEGALPDLVAGRIIREEIVPYFREGDFEGGIEAGVLAIIHRLEAEADAVDEDLVVDDVVVDDDATVPAYEAPDYLLFDEWSLMALGFYLPLLFLACLAAAVLLLKEPAARSIFFLLLLPCFFVGGRALSGSIAFGYLAYNPWVPGVLAAGVFAVFFWSLAQRIDKTPVFRKEWERYFFLGKREADSETKDDKKTAKGVRVAAFVALALMVGVYLYFPWFPVLWMIIAVFLILFITSGMIADPAWKRTFSGSNLRTYRSGSSSSSGSSRRRSSSRTYSSRSSSSYSSRSYSSSSSSSSYSSSSGGSSFSGGGGSFGGGGASGSW
ncbi:MAG: TPM domain-containing protein [Rhodothermales bacterium]